MSSMVINWWFLIANAHIFYILKRGFHLALTSGNFLIWKNSEDEDIALVISILVRDEKKKKKRKHHFWVRDIYKKEKNKEFIVISSESYNMVIGNAFSG